MDYRLGVIGGGNMGGAVVRGAVRAGVFAASDVLVVDTSEDVQRDMAELGCAVEVSPAGVGAACEQLMLAVKPQVFPAVAAAIGELPRSMVVMSVMAGLSSGVIREHLGEHARVIRIMPNTPCQISKGISGIAPGEGAQEGDLDLALRLMQALGAVVEVREAQMYAVTAVSGSGPAYVFRLAEAMQIAAMNLGLDEDQARQLVVETVAGAGALLQASPLPAGELREAVTSPGGTTAAALDVMGEAGLARIVVEAITAARDRGVELDSGD